MPAWTHLYIAASHEFPLISPIHGPRFLIVSGHITTKMRQIHVCNSSLTTLIWGCGGGRRENKNGVKLFGCRLGLTAFGDNPQISLRTYLAAQTLLCSIAVFVV